MPAAKVRSTWVSGNLVFKNLAGTVLATFDNSAGIFHVAGAVRTVRRRCTVAEINAGVTVLAAVPGYAYRLVDAYAVAIGGAAATATGVDLTATLSTARKLVAYYDGRDGDTTGRSMVGQHGSLTSEETLVPLLRAGAFAL